VVREEAIMGTAIRVELWADDRRLGDLAASAVMDEMHRIDRCMSPHKPTSELSRINREAAPAAGAAFRRDVPPGGPGAGLFAPVRRCV
jgi:thiamine biosynthesis lipoprotein ApbE